MSAHCLLGRLRESPLPETLHQIKHVQCRGRPAPRKKLSLFCEKKAGKFVGECWPDIIFSAPAVPAALRIKPDGRLNFWRVQFHEDNLCWPHGRSATAGIHWGQ